MIPEQLNCDECMGTCCRYMVIPIANLTPDEEKWLVLHGVLFTRRGAIFSMPCKKLTDSGKCSIHESAERPAICARARVGGSDCLHSRALMRSLLAKDNRVASNE